MFVMLMWLLILLGGLRILYEAKSFFTIDLPEPRRPTRMRTASVCTAETAKGTHLFKIAGYSLHQGIGIGRPICSTVFNVGGYNWRVVYFPDGDVVRYESMSNAFVGIQLMSAAVEVRAHINLRLVNPVTGRSSPSLLSSQSQVVFTALAGRSPSWGTPVLKSDLVASPFMQDDCIAFQCDLTVVKESWVEETDDNISLFDMEIPPSDLSDNLGNLLESKEGADVKIKVKGHVFYAHKTVLAMRSQFFRARFYNWGRGERETITVVDEDIEPDIFEALLQFIYTDVFPDMRGLDAVGKDEMVQSLLVAADIYAIERLKRICEIILSKRLDIENVAATLVLADQRHCTRLKNDCINFIISSSRIMHDFRASQGYKDLKEICPAVVVEIWDKKAARSRATRLHIKW